MRRWIDALISALGLALVAPVLLATAAWVRLDGGGPVLHTEPRVGRAGRRFPMHKFRTIREDRPASITVAASNDPCITRPGRFLRRWRLDEAPQLYDVLVGHMSLVGPRPQQAENLEAIDAASLARLQAVRPGITGPAVIEFLAEDEALAEVADPVGTYRRIILPEKVRMELDYLDARTLRRDLSILWRTFVRVFSRGARRRSYERIGRLIECGERSAAG